MAKTKKHHDNWARSFVKTVTYRIIIVIAVFITSYCVTHKTSQALQITGWNAATATIIYYLHERFWSRIRWGRN